MAKPTTQTSDLQQRLRKFKEKANQARQLNQQAVRAEAEAPTQGKPKEKAVVDRLREESASDSIQQAEKRREKQELNEFAVNDYHNPEGQYRNYVRSIKSLPARDRSRNTTGDDKEHEESLEVFRLTSVSTIATSAEAAADREGAHRVAEEIHRRYAKSKQREQKRKNRQPDVEGSYINKRNKKLNEKLSRNYDEHTAEIRQNLERGTAL